MVEKANGDKDIGVFLKAIDEEIRKLDEEWRKEFNKTIWNDGYRIERSLEDGQG